MTEVHELNEMPNTANGTWKKLATLSGQQLKDIIDDNLQPSYYVDVNNKEWIVFFVLKQVQRHCNRYDTLLYDVENNIYVQGSNDYQKIIDKCFMDPLDSSTNTSTDHNINNNGEQEKSNKDKLRSAASRSYVVDNDNHVVYWWLST